MSENPYAPPGTDDPFAPKQPAVVQQAGFLMPHRGGTVLALGICGWAVCFICGIFAWSMASKDLDQMMMGNMDPGGHGLTKAGKILGMTSTLIGGPLTLIYIIMIFAAS
jgi:hypothetical protein